MPTGGTANVEARQNRITSLFLAREKGQDPQHSHWCGTRGIGPRQDGTPVSYVDSPFFALGGMISIPRRTS